MKTVKNLLANFGLWLAYRFGTTYGPTYHVTVGRLPSRRIQKSELKRHAFQAFTNNEKLNYSSNAHKAFKDMCRQTRKGSS